MRLLIFWLWGGAGTAVAVFVGYFWLDRPVAIWLHQFRNSHSEILLGLGHVSDPMVSLAIVGFFLLAVMTFLKSPLSKAHAMGFLCSINIAFVEVVKDRLKFLFGRTWPETWVHNNPSFIRDGIYGFNFMHSGSMYQSFPSGHMATFCAVITIFWIWYPRYRWVYTSLGLIAGTGLVALNYHFFSDVVAGAFVGIFISAASVTIWKASARIIIDGEAGRGKGHGRK